ncbi:protein of unknown function (plasmid) [Cupriavidus taiwanensis]|uniref:Uncharacterized protein n=1 Tax=Cupriavidus taiwanensis TaxID=164546 RepID=A0A375IMS4_9BURK|nr:protein of unknown function [Cupriavidus taiwanensis]
MDEVEVNPRGAKMIGNAFGKPTFAGSRISDNYRSGEVHAQADSSRQQILPRAVCRRSDCLGGDLECLFLADSSQMRPRSVLPHKYGTLARSPPGLKASARQSH